MSLPTEFTRIPNYVINNNRLSIAARFLYLYIASKPADYRHYITYILEALDCSEDSLQKYTKELEDAGFMIREQRRENGKFSYNYYKLLER
jgi:predicted transcriptional regulator